MLSLQDSVSAVPGVGPKTAENLATLNILSVEDLLTYYPLRYDNFEVQSVQNAKDQEKITIKGTVMSEPVIARFGYKKID